jgi:hypothetical protein
VCLSAFCEGCSTVHCIAYVHNEEGVIVVSDVAYLTVFLVIYWHTAAVTPEEYLGTLSSKYSQLNIHQLADSIMKCILIHRTNVFIISGTNPLAYSDCWRMSSHLDNVS